MAETIQQHDKFSRDRVHRHVIPLGSYLPFSAATYPGSGVTYNAIATKTDLTLAPVSATAAGTAIAVTSVSATTNAFTLASHGYQNQQVLQVSSSGTIPAPLAASTNYYVVGRTSSTFQLAASLDGPAIDLTDAGSGTISVQVPATYPWYAYNVPRSSGLLLPYPMSIAIGLDDANSAGLSVSGTITGEDIWGNVQTEAFTTLADATAGGTFTVRQTDRAWRRVWRVAVTAIGTAASGDVMHVGMHGGAGGAIATIPRANLAVPIKKPTTGCVQSLSTATERTVTPTVNTTYGTVKFTDATTGDFTAATMVGANMILDPTAML